MDAFILIICFLLHIVGVVAHIELTKMHYREMRLMEQQKEKFRKIACLYIERCEAMEKKSFCPEKYLELYHSPAKETEKKQLEKYDA